MTGKERLRCCALLCIWTAGCYGSFDDIEPSCRAPLSAGDIRITEILANPKGPDGQQEYIELFNATAAELDLSGAVLVASRQDGSGERGHAIREQTLSPGGYIVLGNAAPDTLGHVDYSYGSALGSLRNSDARVALVCGGTVVDEAGYATTTEGYALELDGSGDSVDRWCPSSKSSETSSQPLAGNFGTPGAPNRNCPVILEPGTCIDEGRVRDIRVPATGELRITEWMANPASVSDSDGEWFEVKALADVDLNELMLSDSSSSETLIEQDLCLPLSKGSSLLFARELDEASNGGLPGAELAFNFSLNNENELIRLSVGGEQLDLISYQASTPGASTQVDVNGDVCTSQTAYGSGDLGSPGELNPVCP